MNTGFIFIDTHFHPTMKQYSTETSIGNATYIYHVLQRAQEAQVKKLICVSTNTRDCTENYKFSIQNKCAFYSLGIHPCDIKENKDFKPYYTLFESLISEKLVAIGEIGLDFYRDGYNKQAQIKMFKYQIEYALEKKLPIIIHSRASYDETLLVLDEYKKENITGVVHAFDGNIHYANEWTKRKFKLGIGGMVTYPKNTKLQEAIKQCSIEDILFETDAPFLPPQGFRGKINEPSHIPLIAQFTADLREEPFEQLGKQVEKNTYKLFTKI